MLEPWKTGVWWHTGKQPCSMTPTFPPQETKRGSQLSSLTSLLTWYVILFFTNTLLIFQRFWVAQLQKDLLFNLLPFFQLAFRLDLNQACVDQNQCLLNHFCFKVTTEISSWQNIWFFSSGLETWWLCSGGMTCG